MNKRIKKKKAKQALQHEQERGQELEQFLQNTEQIQQALKQVGFAISNAFMNLSTAFANAAKHWRKWGEQLDKENSD